MQILPPFATTVADGRYTRQAVHEMTALAPLRQFLPLHDHRFASVLVQGGLVVEVDCDEPAAPVVSKMEPTAQVAAAPIESGDTEQAADARREVITAATAKQQALAESAANARAAKRLPGDPDKPKSAQVQRLIDGKAKAKAAREAAAKVAK